MFACRRVLTTTTARYIHTAPAVLSESEGLFGKFNPWAKKQQTQEVTPAQRTTEEPTNVTFNVKYEEAEEVVSWKKTEVLTDEAEIESTVQSIILQNVQGATESNWKQLPLKDLNTKFQILKECIKQTGKEVPSYKLTTLNGTKEVLEFFKLGEIKKELTVEEFFKKNADSLPSNIKFVPRR